MGEAELEQVLLGFMKHEYDVFVCTTIVENGLDIPLANTILIENAERYGLSELYQLRGRVGRSNRRAYAYLLVPADTELSDVARKRLAALKEFSDLGAGFKIAALDLELRGAGNFWAASSTGISRRSASTPIAAAGRDRAGTEGRGSSARDPRALNLGWTFGFRRNTSRTNISECGPISAFRRLTPVEEAMRYWRGTKGPLWADARGCSQSAAVRRGEEPGREGRRGSNRPAGRNAQHQVPPDGKVDPARLMEIVTTVRERSLRQRACCGFP